MQVSQYLMLSLYKITKSVQHPFVITVQKALNGIQWDVAHPLTLNYRAPIALHTVCRYNKGSLREAFMTQSGKKEIEDGS